MMLNSVVLPAPLGPMTPSISCSATVSPTSRRIVAPPICRPMPSRASAGRSVICSSACRSAGGDRGRDVRRVHGVDQLRSELATLVSGELGLVHVLDDRVVLGADLDRALDGVEGGALEGVDHGLDVRAA